MRSSINNAMSSVRRVVLVSMMFAAVGAVWAGEPQAAEAPAQAARYADAKWVKLGDLVPIETTGPDVYVRLIAVEGEVLLPPDFAD